MNVLDCAIKMEEAARMHYEELATATKVPELKNLFTLLAAAEQEHHAALVKMKNRISIPEATFELVQEAAIMFKPLLAKRDVMAELAEDPDDYRHVVKEEAAGIKLYEELAAQAEDAGVRKVLRMLADEERKHLSIVENIYAFVESPKNYLAWGEFGNLQEY